MVGMGATVLSGARIGSGSIVGANALVSEGKQFPDGVLLLGVPAKVVRRVSEAEIAEVRGYAQHYTELARECKTRNQAGGAAKR